MTYQVMPDLTAEEYAELKADIARRGVMVAIEFDELGNVLDGHHRLRACSELGIADYPKVIRAGLSEDEKRAHARKLNMARRHLTQEQRRELIREQLRETPEKSDRQIAAGLGVNHETVGAQRKHLESTGGIRQFATSIGADGKERPRQVERRTEPEPTPPEDDAALFLGWHDVTDFASDIYAADVIVESVYWGGKWFSGNAIARMTLKEATDRFLQWVEMLGNSL